jgi:hypothetical protein
MLDWSKGKRIGIDPTTLVASVALQSIVRQALLHGLAEQPGIVNRTSRRPSY